MKMTFILVLSLVIRSMPEKGPIMFLFGGRIIACMVRREMIGYLALAVIMKYQVVVAMTD